MIMAIDRPRRVTVTPFPSSRRLVTAAERAGKRMAEVRRVKHAPSTSAGGRLLERAGPVGTRVPGAVAAMYAIMARSVAVRRRTGTVAVTAVGMFAGGGGFGLAPMTLMSSRS